MEEWRLIPGVTGYEASSLGRVRSIDRVLTAKNGQTRRLLGRVLRPAVHSVKHPYAFYHFGLQGGHRGHQLVAWAFLGSQPIGTQVCHNDGDPRNNASGNLRYDTPKGNQADRRLHGTALTGERHPMAKLSDAAVIDIKQLLANGILQADIAIRYGVSQSWISNIKHGVR